MPPRSSNNDLETMFRRALRRARTTATAALRGPALAGAMVLTSPIITGCQADMSSFSENTEASWIHDEGQRNTDMVSFIGFNASDCQMQNPRFGCEAYDAIVKLKVKQVDNADLSYKKVGVQWRNPTTGANETAMGHWFTNYGDGYEEWHVPVRVSTWNDLFLFDAWYQDGAYHTYYDDNSGESHAIEDADDNANYTTVIRHEGWLSSAELTDYGVSGTVSVRVVDLDWDKDLYMVATVDDWQTVHEFGMGAAGDTNAWYWVEDFLGGQERWEIDLDIPGDYQELQFALRYRHGVVNYARSYDFWDNNYQQNHSITRQPEVQ